MGTGERNERDGVDVQPDGKVLWGLEGGMQQAVGTRQIGRFGKTRDRKHRASRLLGS